MEANKLKHLEFVQNVITRMNTNSFLIKGWAITLTGALMALAAQNYNQKFILINLGLLLAFWILDGFYLSQERQFRKLYTEVASKKEKDIDFRMKASSSSNCCDSWFFCIFSKTLIVFYLSIVAISFATLKFMSL